MEIWLDTTDTDTIREAAELGILHGVTTNPTLVAQSGHSLEDLLDELLDIQDGPVAVQVVSDQCNEIIRQAELLTAHSPRVIVKVPVTISGLKTINQLSKRKIAVMATAIFDEAQALLAFKAGAHYLAPYVGRIEKSGDDPYEVLAAMTIIKSNFNFPGKIIAAGINDIDTVVFSAVQCGIDAVTIGDEVFREFIEEHMGTTDALARFHSDWREAKSTDLLPTANGGNK